ncbi:MAG: hypothetical protein R2806_19160 [Saprospiraceae bacterium]
MDTNCLNRAGNGIYLWFVHQFYPVVYTNHFNQHGRLRSRDVYWGAIWSEKKVNSSMYLQGALVEVDRCLFYVVVTTLMKPEEGQVVYGLSFWLEDLAKIGGGAIGAYLALKQLNRIQPQ